MAKKSRAKRSAYVNPKCPNMLKGPFKSFTVAGKAQITGADGVKRLAGEEVKLNEKCANFFANLGYVVVDMKFDADKDAEIAKLKSKLAEDGRAEEGASGDADEAEAGDASDSDGGEPSDGSVPDADDEPPRKSGRRRRSVSS